MSQNLYMWLWCISFQRNYRQISNISRTSVANEIDDYPDVGGALPVGVAPTTSSFST